MIVKEKEERNRGVYVGDNQCRGQEPCETLTCMIRGVDKCRSWNINSIHYYACGAFGIFGKCYFATACITRLSYLKIGTSQPAFIACFGSLISDCEVP